MFLAIFLMEDSSYFNGNEIKKNFFEFWFDHNLDKSKAKFIRHET